MEFAQATFKKFKRALGISSTNTTNAKKEDETAQLESTATNPFVVTQVYEDTPGKTPISEQYVVWIEFTEDGIKMLNHTEKKQISLFSYADVKSYHHGTQQQLWGFEAVSKEYPEFTRFLFKTKHVAVIGETKDEFMKKFCLKYNKAENLKKLEQEKLEIEKLKEEQARQRAYSTKTRSFSIKTPASDKAKSDSPATALRTRAKTLLSRKPKGDSDHIKKTFQKPTKTDEDKEDEDKNEESKEEIKLDSSRKNLLDLEDTKETED